jgi:hypothetical protein
VSYRLAHRLDRLETRLAGGCGFVSVLVPHGMDINAPLARLHLEPDAGTTLPIITDFCDAGPRLLEPTEPRAPAMPT